MKKRGRNTASRSSIVEGADYLLDIDMTEKRKKKFKADAEDSRWEETYVQFFLDLEKYLESGFVEDEEEEDPMYVMFLESLKEHGKAYMLNVSIKHGVFTPIIYEAEIDESVRGTKRKYPKTRQSTREFYSGLSNSGSVSEAESDRSNVKRRKTSRHHEQHNFRKERSVKNSGFGKKGVESDSPDSIMREASTMRRRYNMRERRGSESGRKVNTGLDHSARKGGLGINSELKPRTRSHSNIQKKGDLHEKSAKDANETFNNIHKKGGLHEESAKDASETYGNIQKKGDLHEKSVKDANGTYNSFFTGVKIDGDSMSYQFGDEPKVSYERSGQQKSKDNNNEAALSNPRSTAPITTPLSPTINPSNGNASVSKKAVDEKGEDPKIDWDSKHGKQLRKILEKPFDQNEFNELWKEMNHRSHVQGHRESRSGGSCRPGQLSKSYLDLFPVLDEEISKVKSDSRKVLTLLRMLSFYLVKCCSGVPPPWKVADCRKMFL